MADVKKVKSPQDFMSSCLSFLVVLRLILSAVDFLMGGVSAVCILFTFFVCLTSSSLFVV